MRRFKFTKMLLSIFAVVVSISGITAEDVYLSIDRSAITPTRHEKMIKKLPASVSVITKEDIKMSNPNQTTDILEQVPGLFIRRTSAFGRADVDIRGLGDNGRQVGVLIDGRPDKMGIFGCAVTHTLPLNNVERIEVIRGPESVLYGSEAFGGIVNIITKRAKEKFEGGFVASYGTYNTLKSRLQIGSKLDKVDYFISTSKNSTDGHITNSSYTATDITGQFGYKFSDKSELSFSGKSFSGTKNEPFPSVAGTWNTYDRGSFDATYKQNLNIADMSVKLYRSFGKHKFSDGFHSTDYTDGAMVHGFTMLSSRNEMSMGIDYRYQSGNILNTSPAKFIGEKHKYEYGVYVDDKQMLSNKLTVNAGARYNYDEYAKDAVTPKMGVVYNLTDSTILRGIWSQGFRAPQINDLFLWGGNENLKPEKVTNKEVGIRKQFGENIYIDIGTFVMNGSDLIETVNSKKQNTGNFEFKGVETASNIRFSDSINGQVNYTYFDSGTKTQGRPGDKFVTSLKYAQGKLSGLVSGEYVGRYYAGDNSTQKINDYSILNLKVNYNVVKNLSVFGTIDNLTDVDYHVYYSGLYTMPKRTLSLGIDYTF